MVVLLFLMVLQACHDIEYGPVNVAVAVDAAFSMEWLNYA